MVQRPTISPDSQPKTADSPGNGTGGPGRQCFEKSHRLTDAAAFNRVFSDARRSRDRLFTVLSCRNDSESARLGLAISRKHCRKATERNRVKRIVRESFRHHLPMLAGLDVVVLAQSATPAAANSALFDSLAKHWQNTRSAHFSQGNGRRP